MNGYDLSRQWFSFAYENTEAKPIHTALYFWIVERANASGWKKAIDVQTEKSMECLGVTDWRTYKNALQFLADHNFIAWLEKSKNQYTCNRVAIVLKEGETCDSYRNAYANNAEPHAEAIAEAIAEAYAEPYVKAIAEALQSYINLKTNKPIKPKNKKTPPAAPVDDLFEGLPEGFTDTWEKFQKLYLEKYPAVAKLEKQLTPKELHALLQEYSKGEISSTLEAMENYKKVGNYRSVYLTLKKWIVREIAKAA